MLKKRLLGSQFRQSLQTMAHSLRVGTGLQQALQRAAQDCDLPLAGEWRTVLTSVTMGMPLNQALAELAQRVPLAEIQGFVAAVQICQETGGSLAGVLETLAHTLQEHEALRDKVAALTAQGKASGCILGLLPFILMEVLHIVAPELIRPLFTTSAGYAMLGAVIVGVSLGGITIFKIVSVKMD